MNRENKSIIDMHKPHPGNIVKLGALKDVYEKLVMAAIIHEENEDNTTDKEKGD